MGCLFSRERERGGGDPSASAPREVAGNYLILRRVFSHLDAASLARCSRALPRRTEWGAAAAAAIADRAGCAAPALFEIMLNLREFSVVEDAKDKARLRRGLLDFAEETLDFEPALVVSSSQLLACEILGLWPKCPLVHVSGASTFKGFVTDYLFRKNPRPFHTAMILPPRRGMAVTPFSLSKSDVSSRRRPILPVLMGKNFAGQAADIKCIIIFVRARRGRRHRDAPSLWLSALLAEVGAAVGNQRGVAVAGHEAHDLSLEKGQCAYGAVISGPSVEACSVLMDYPMTGRCQRGEEEVRRNHIYLHVT